MIATPLLAMVTDMKTAVIYVAIPTLVLNLSLLIIEGNFLQTIKRFYLLAVIAMIGTVCASTRSKLLILAVASNPSSTGIRISIKIT